MKYEEVLSILHQLCFNFAFKSNLRRLHLGPRPPTFSAREPGGGGGSLHSSTFQGLHSSTFRHDMNTF